MNKPSLILAVLALTSGLVACGGADEGGSGSSTKLNLVAYSTPKEAYEEIIPAFAKTPDGTEATLSQSYSNSGDQARAVIAGLPTDIAALSLEPDITKLVDERLVAADWSSTPTKGIVTRSVVALARALAVQPRVLLLDEPFGALDATVRKELRDWLRKLHDEVHVTTIFVTHDQEEALEVAQQVAVINAGRIEQTGTPDDLYERPANPFVMGFVGPVSRLGDAWVRPHDIELLEDDADGAVQAIIERVARVGFEVRIEAALGDGTPVPVLATRQQADELELHAGQIVWLRVHRTREFAA